MTLAMIEPQAGSASAAEPALSPDLLIKMHDLMLKARLLEKQMISMLRSGHAYFWIGGPGEEAFSVPLGLLVHKGQGPAYDYLHLHYRSSGTIIAMGVDPIDPLRQMNCAATDPYSGGRNFAGHFSIRAWNVVPVSSPIEVQYAMAPGTAIAQKRAGGRGITIVQGGDAGTAEGDFASCLVWSSRPGNELPMLIIVTNNQWGISTPASEQHGEKRISDRGKAFGMETATIDGNDPEVSYRALARAMEYVRKERRPFLLEAMVSRLYGHSSSSGANYVNDEDDPRKHEVDCLVRFEERLLSRGILTRATIDALHERYKAEMLELSKRVREEPRPTADDALAHIFSDRDLVSSKGAS